MCTSRLFLLVVALLTLFLSGTVNGDVQCVGADYGCKIIDKVAHCWGKITSAGMYPLSTENAFDDFAGDYAYEKARPILVPNVFAIWCGATSLFLRLYDESVVFHGLNSFGMAAIGQKSNFGGGIIQDGWLQANKVPLENITMKMLNSTEKVYTQVYKVAASRYFQCTLFSSYKVKCHGVNSDLQLARTGPNPAETATGNEIPYVQLGGKDLTVHSTLPQDKFGCGNSHCCAVAQSPTPSSYGLYCWGEGSLLGVGGSTPLSTPTKVNLDVNTDSDYAKYPACTEVSALAVRFTTTCIHCSDNKVRCWGNNAAWKLGIPEADYVGLTNYFGDELTEMGPGRIPIPVSLGLSATYEYMSFALGSSFSCVVASSVGLKCWGGGMTTLNATSGRYANTSLPDHYGMGANLPALLSSSMVSMAFAGESIACYQEAVWTSTRATRCWGYRRQIGAGDWYAGAPGIDDNDIYAGDNYRTAIGPVQNDSILYLNPVQFGAASYIRLSSLVVVAMVWGCI